MRGALIGHTGFVGGNLLREHPFSGRYNSTNINSIAGEHFDLIVCAGAPAAKWKANADPAADRACLGRLMTALERVTTQRFVHISTVDVYGQPASVDEDCPPSGASAYGRHRLELEQFVRDRFQAMVVRLPALFGPGLKKNAIYDLMNNNQVEKIDTRSVFQFYNIRRLWGDIRLAGGARLSLIHLSTEPVSMGEVASGVFGREWINHLPGIPPTYDVRTKHAALFGGSGGYISNKTRVLAELSEFVGAQKGGRQCA